MRYIVLCHTNTVDRSKPHEKTEREHERTATHTMLQCVNRDDADRVVRSLENDDRFMEDGPYLITRYYEVGVVTFTGNKRVTLSVSDIEQIVNEYNAPRATRVA